MARPASLRGSPREELEGSTGHARCILVCHVIVFISPALGTPWRGVWDPAGSSPIPPGQQDGDVSRRCLGCHPVLTESPLTQLTSQARPRASVLPGLCTFTCAGTPGSGRADAALCPQACLGPPAASFPPPAPGGGRGLLISLQDEMLVHPQRSPRGSCLQSRLTLSVRVLSWGGSPGAPPPGAESGPA